MLFRQIFDERLAQYAYLVGCQATGEAILFDPERDVDRYLELAAREGLRITAVAETHIHADFLSGARELVHRDPGIKAFVSGEGGADWQSEWVRGLDNVRVLKDGDIFSIGNIEIRAVHTPGHTPEHLSFLVTDRGSGAVEPIGLISGDFVFAGDLGRPDLLESAAGVQGVMEPSARALYRSARSFLELPDYLQVWPAHGAGSACGKALGAVPTTTVGYERLASPALESARTSEDRFVEFILEGQPEPPLYFARMKKLNKWGPEILGDLPRPRRLRPGQRPAQAVVIDTRPDRTRFFESHLEGSLWAPFDRSFLSIAGSFVEPEEEIVLVVDPQDLEEAVRSLIRIGLDRVVGWIPTQDLKVDTAGVRSSLATVDFDAFVQGPPPGDSVILDVRGGVEFDQGHLEGAVNVAHTRLKSRLHELPRDRTLYVHCATGRRSAASAALLARHGFRVVDVDGAFRRPAAGVVS